MRRLFFHEESIHEVSRRYLEHEYIHTYIHTYVHTYIHTDKPKPICPPHFFKVGGINKAVSQENPFSGFPTRPNTNRALQPQKMAGGFKFQIKIGEGFYYLCSENKGADQLSSYHPADHHICFHICKNTEQESNSKVLDNDTET